jgi:hypothetical protein
MSIEKPPAAGRGRPKGSLNKTTAVLKDAIIQAATNAGGEGGLVAYLQAQAKESPAAFLVLLGKVLPKQVIGEDGGPLQHSIIERHIVDPAS